MSAVWGEMTHSVRDLDGLVQQIKQLPYQRHRITLEQFLKYCAGIRVAESAGGPVGVYTNKDNPRLVGDLTTYAQFVKTEEEKEAAATDTAATTTDPAASQPPAASIAAALGQPAASGSLLLSTQPNPSLLAGAAPGSSLAAAAATGGRASSSRAAAQPPPTTSTRTETTPTPTPPAPTATPPAPTQPPAAAAAAAGEAGAAGTGAAQPAPGPVMLSLLNLIFPPQPDPAAFEDMGPCPTKELGCLTARMGWEMAQLAQERAQQLPPVDISPSPAAAAGDGGDGEAAAEAEADAEVAAAAASWDSTTTLWRLQSDMEVRVMDQVWEMYQQRPPAFASAGQDPAASAAAGPSSAAPTAAAAAQSSAAATPAPASAAAGPSSAAPTATAATAAAQSSAAAGPAPVAPGPRTNTASTAGGTGTAAPTVASLQQDLWYALVQQQRLAKRLQIVGLTAGKLMSACRELLIERADLIDERDQAMAVLQRAVNDQQLRTQAMTALQQEEGGVMHELQQWASNMAAAAGAASGDAGGDADMMVE